VGGAADPLARAHAVHPVHGRRRESGISDRLGIPPGAVDVPDGPNGC
jgi:hypothetical protein